MSNYQKKIIDALKNGALLQCNEGKNYKTWLVYPDGKKENVRRNSANKVCIDYADKLIFGDLKGIKFKNN